MRRSPLILRLSDPLLLHESTPKKEVRPKSASLLLTSARPLAITSGTQSNNKLARALPANSPSQNRSVRHWIPQCHKTPSHIPRKLGLCTRRQHRGNQAQASPPSRTTCECQPSAPPVAPAMPQRSPPRAHPSTPGSPDFPSRDMDHVGPPKAGSNDYVGNCDDYSLSERSNKGLLRRTSAHIRSVPLRDALRYQQPHRD